MIAINRAISRAARRTLRDDRGENSLMHFLSQNVALIIMVPMMGIMALMMIGSQQITADVTGQSSIKIAGDQFSADFSNADRIVPLSSNAAASLSSRYTLTGERMSSTDALTDDQRQCRLSVWEIQRSTGKIVNTILWGNPSHPGGFRFASCETATISQINSWVATAKTSSNNAQAATVSHPVAAGAESATFSFYNAAHNELKVNASGGVTLASTADPSGWYTEPEWTSPIIAEVRLQGKADLEIAGEKGYVFTGKTNQLLGVLRTCDPTDPLTATNPACNGPETPTTEHWVPDPPTNVVVQRCTTQNGSIDPGNSGHYECAEVTFDPPPASQCGPYPMAFKVYAANDRRTGGQPTEFVAHGTSSPILINNIWNGNTYTISVTAYCDGSGDRESDRAEVPFTQSLPQPRVSIEFPNPALESTQRVFWAAPTSDPSVTYFVRYQNYDAGTPRANWKEISAPRSGVDNGRTYILPDPVRAGNWQNASDWAPDTTRTYTGRTINQGFPIYYGVKARVPSPTTGHLESDYGFASIIYSLKPSKPPVTVITPGPGTVTITTDNSATCPANTTAQYAFQVNSGRNGAGLAGMIGEWHTGWQSSSSVTRPNTDGQLIVARVLINCSTEFVPAPDINTMLGNGTYSQNRTNDAADTGTTGDSGRINRASEPLWQFNSQDPDRMNPTLASPWQGFVRVIAQSPAMAQPTRTEITKNSSRGNWVSQACVAGTIQHRVVNTVVNDQSGLSNIWMDWTNTTNTETESHLQTVTPGGSRFTWNVDQRCHVALPAFELPDKNHSNPDGTRDAAGGIAKDQYSASRLSPNQTFYTLVPAPPLAIWPSNAYPREGVAYNILISGGTCETGNTFVQVANESGAKTAQSDTIFNGIAPKWVNSFLYSGYCKFDNNGTGNPSTSTDPVKPPTPAQAVADATKVTTTTEIQDDDILEPKSRPEITVTRNASGQAVGTVTNMANICQADATPWIGWQHHQGISAARTSTSVAHVSPGTTAWVEYKTAANATQVFTAGSVPGQVLVIRASVRCVMSGINTPTMDQIMTAAKYNQDDEDSITTAVDTAAINADIKPSWTYKSVTQPGALGTDARNWLDSRAQPVRTSIWKGHFRPMGAPVAPTALQSSADGKRIYTSWSGASCVASEAIAAKQYRAKIHTINTGSVLVDFYLWGNAQSAYVDTGYTGGSRFVWDVTVRCHVQLPAFGIPTRTVNAGGDASGVGYVRDQYSPERTSGSNTAYSQVNGPGLPGIGGPGSVGEGDSYHIWTSDGACEWGAAWAYSANPYSWYTAPRDWVWPTAPGPRWYTVSGYCYVPSGFNGGATQYSGTVSNSTVVSFWNVDPQPAPSTPGGLSAIGGGAWVTCDASSGGGRIRWDASWGASYYVVTVSWPDGDNIRRSDSFTVWGTEASYTATGGVWNSFNMTFSVTAVGPGGSSGTNSIGLSRTPGCISGG